MGNYDRIMAMQEASMAQEMLLGISRERLSDRNIEIRTSEEDMRTLFHEAIEGSFVELQNIYNIAMAEIGGYTSGIDPYRIDEKPIQDDDQIIF